MTERFKKPTEKQIFDLAVLFNEGVIDIGKLSDMVGMATLIVERLYDNGDITVPCIQEQIDRALENLEE